MVLFCRVAGCGECEYVFVNVYVGDCGGSGLRLSQSSGIMLLELLWGASLWMVSSNGENTVYRSVMLPLCCYAVSLNGDRVVISKLIQSTLK